MNFKNDPVKLPEIRFVAGETQSLLFDVVRDSGAAFDLTGCTAAFAVQRPNSQSAEPMFSTAMSVYIDDTKKYLRLDLAAEDSIDWCGMLDYQISIKDINDTIYIPGHGSLVVTRNIHQQFVEG